MNHTHITNFSSESLSPSSDKAKFPSDFVWGAATSSYQIEGAVTEDGKVHDPNRIDFLARYLGELKKAATAADIRGYFHWSLMDNFEWSKGYSERFGLIYVDYRTQQRIMKDSAYWYRDYIKNNGEI